MAMSNVRSSPFSRHFSRAQRFDNVQYDLTGLGRWLVLCLRKIRVLHVLAFFETASTWWFQDSLLLIFMPIDVLCSVV